MDSLRSRRTVVAALTLLILFAIFRLSPETTRAALTEALLRTGSPDGTAPVTATAGDTTSHETVTPAKKPFGEIKDKVAMISDTQYTPRLIPLILHFHSVLGPEWPIVFFTTEDVRDSHLAVNGSGAWKKAVHDGRIQVRIIPGEFDLTQRQGVNLYLSRPWLWEQLAPAKRVLVFQADAMICGNSRRPVDDFLEWDFIGAALHPREKYFNGGLSLRNRGMMLDLLRAGASWEDETASGAWTLGGEDVWFSKRMAERGAHLPDKTVAVTFAAEHRWHVDAEKHPFGYHKVHKYAAKYLPQIAEWCPEIALAAPGTLKDAE